jgi:predicted metal-dependent HD superfamily phosphohydrolase
MISFMETGESRPSDRRSTRIYAHEVDLAEQFSATVARVGGRASEAVPAELLARWSEPHRRYHTVDHLRTVLAVVDAWADAAARPDLVRLALWGHDAIYDPRAAGDANEQASAILSARLLHRCTVPAAAVAEVMRLVRLTAGHCVARGDRDGALLADADLAVLAGDWPAYAVYAAQIRQEYAHVPDEAFRLGRGRVLEGLLALPELYHTPQLHEAWEARARANVSRELAGLRS